MPGVDGDKGDSGDPGMKGDTGAIGVPGKMVSHMTAQSSHMT